jgi:hypothetical protein
MLTVLAEFFEIKIAAPTMFCVLIQLTVAKATVDLGQREPFFYPNLLPMDVKVSEIYV